MSNNGHLLAQDGQRIHRKGPEGYLVTRDLCSLFGRHRDTLGQHDIKGGKIAPVGGGKGSSPFRFAWEDVVTYWRTVHQGRCMRCTIMREATPERGFLCEPCAYEVETGRMWWPDFPRPGRGGLPQGRLVFKLPDRWGVHVSW